ncbi:MAG: hypothetical protein ACP5NE_03680 [Candidatus Micrarchaeia archaeon]
MVEKNMIDKIAAKLNADPSKANWERFWKLLPKSKAKYYKVFYPKKLESKKELAYAYAIIYDANYKQMFRIPIFIKEDNDIEGATIYLKGLLNTNKDYKEWIS